MRRHAHRWVAPLVAAPVLASVAVAALAAGPAAASPAVKQPTPTATSKTNPGKGHPGPTPSPTASPTPSPTPSPTATRGKGGGNGPRSGPTTAPTVAPPPVQVGPAVPGVKAPVVAQPPAPGVQRPTSQATSRTGSGGSATRPGVLPRATTSPASSARPRATQPAAPEQFRLHHDERAELGPIVHSLSQGATSNPQLPLGLFGVLGVFLLVQNRIDRRDPKLAVTQAWSSVELEFAAVRRKPAAVRKAQLPVRLRQVERPVAATDLLPLR